MTDTQRDQGSSVPGPCTTDPVPPAPAGVTWEPSLPLRPTAARAEPPKDRVGWLMSATSLLLLLSIFLPYMVEKMTFAATRGKQRALYELAGENLQHVGLQDLSLAYQMIANRVEPSVVHISVVALPGAADLVTGGSPWPHPSTGQGSGIIVDPEGYIVTNAHVLFQASQIRVRLSDGRALSATVVGTDRETDMAVVKVPAGNLIAAQWGDSEEIEVGALVWAVGSPLGLQAKEVMARGDLVSDEILLGMLKDRFSRDDTRAGFILDGYPRNLAQAAALDRLLAELGQAFDAAVQLTVDNEQIIERLAGRAKAEGRADDSPESVRHRLNVYDQQTAPVIDFYRQHGQLTVVDGVGSLDEVFTRIIEAIQPGHDVG